MKKFLILISLLLISPVVCAEGELAQPELFKNEKTSIKNPLELRDPFKRKKSRGKSGAIQRLQLGKDGVYSNLPTIDGSPIDAIRITGVMLGRERRAIARVLVGGAPTKDTYILKEGMKIGENEAEIKAILPGGVVLVEKIRNVYDQDEYIETVIPITSIAEKSDQNSR